MVVVNAKNIELSVANLTPAIKKTVPTKILFVGNGNVLPSPDSLSYFPALLFLAIEQLAFFVQAVFALWLNTTGALWPFVVVAVRLSDATPVTELMLHLFHQTTVQTEPEGMVTVIPEFMVTGPADMAFLLVVMV